MTKGTAIKLTRKDLPESQSNIANKDITLFDFVDSEHFTLDDANHAAIVVFVEDDNFTKILKNRYW